MVGRDAFLFGDHFEEFIGKAAVGIPAGAVESLDHGLPRLRRRTERVLVGTEAREVHFRIAGN